MEIITIVDFSLIKKSQRKKIVEVCRRIRDHQLREKDAGRCFHPFTSILFLVLPVANPLFFLPFKGGRLYNVNANHLGCFWPYMTVTLGKVWLWFFLREKRLYTLQIKGLDYANLMAKATILSLLWSDCLRLWYWPVTLQYTPIYFN